MARTYDTGLAAPQRTLIRAAIGTKLAPLLKANGGYVRKIGVLPRPIRGDSNEDLGLLVVAINSVTPAIVIALGRKTLEPTGTDGLEWEGSLEIVIYAASSHRRDDVDGRLAEDVVAAADATADPGIEVMLEQIEEQLLGQSLPIATTLELRESTEDETITFAEYAVWEQRYTARVRRDINPNRAITAIVTSVDTKTIAVDTNPADPLNPVIETITALEAPP